jgi:hypothetical protein
VRNIVARVADLTVSCFNRSILHAAVSITAVSAACCWRKAVLHLLTACATSRKQHLHAYVSWRSGDSALLLACMLGVLLLFHMLTCRGDFFVDGIVLYAGLSAVGQSWSFYS